MSYVVNAPPSRQIAFRYFRVILLAEIIVAFLADEEILFVSIAPLGEMLHGMREVSCGLSFAAFTRKFLHPADCAGLLQIYQVN